MIFLIIFHFLWIILKGIELIYFFQIKEYRFDRLNSQIKEKGYFPFFYSLSIKLPKRSMRNLLLVLFHLAITSSVFLYSFEQIALYDFLAYSLFIAPIFSFVVIASGVLWTNIPSFLLIKISQYNAMNKVKKSKAIFIGITGSYGKTSTKEFLYQILSAKFNVAKTEENMNTPAGIAISINKNLTNKTDIFIVELGAYKKGEIKQAASYINFDHIILTGLGNQHLDLYGSRDNLITEESSPIALLQPGNKAYVNSSVPNLKSLKKLKTEIITYGGAKYDSITDSNISQSKNGISANIHYQKQIFSIKTSLLGNHFLENLMPCVAIASDLGMKKQEIEKSVKSVSQIKGKLSIHKGYGGATIIFDGVNSNLNGFLSAIDTLELFPQKNKIIVTQGIIELGAEKRSSYDKLISSINKSKIKLFSTDKLFSKISKNNQVFTFNDVSSLKNNVKKRLNKGTVMLIEGKFSDKFIKTFI